MSRRAHALRRLRRPEDAAGVFFSAVVWAAWLLAFALFTLPTHLELQTLADRVAFVLAVGFLLGLAGGANVVFNLHNHVHRPFFVAPRANLWFERLTALTAGWPAFLWAHMHRTHHARVLTSADWTAPRALGNGRTESLLAFSLFRWPARVFANLRADLEAGRICEAASARTELKVFALLWCLPALLGPSALLGLWVLPHLVANLIVLPSFAYLANLGAREGNDEHSLTRANSFVGPLFDRLSFHWGLASVHYAWPDVHWSRLPELHARERARMVEEGTHVLPWGGFQAAVLLGGFTRVAEAQLEFTRTQARDYGTPIGLRTPQRPAAGQPEREVHEQAA